MPATTVALARPRTSARLLAVAATLLAVAVVLVAGALPASAHDRLVSSSPADGQVLDAAPESVVLTFSSAPLAAGAQVVVTGPDGAPVPADQLSIDGGAATVSMPLPTDVAGGAYTVVWHVVSGDGHPIEGTFRYTVTARAGAGPAASASPEPAPVAAETSADPVPQETSVPPAQGGDDASALIIAVSVAAAAVVAVAAFFVLRRKVQDNEDLRRNKPQDPDAR